MGGAVDEFERAAGVADGLEDADAFDDGAEGEGGVGVELAGGFEGGQGAAGFAVKTLQQAERLVVEAGTGFAGETGEVERLGEAAARSFAQLLVEGDPWFVFGRNFAAPAAGLGGGVGFVERVADDHGHPREHALAHVGALGEGEALEQAFVEDVEVGGEGEVGFVDVAEGGGGAAHQERGGPVGVGVAQGGGAERVDVHGDGSATEAGIAHGAAEAPSIPTVVEGRVGDGEAGGKNVGHVVEDDGHAVVPAFGGGVLQPFVAFAVAALGDAAAVDIGPAEEAVLLGVQAVIDHAPHGGGIGCVEAGDEQESGGHRGFDDGGEAAEVGVGHDAEAVLAEGSEDGQLGIDGGFVVAGDGVRGVGAGRGGLVGFGGLDDGADFQRQAADQRDEADAAVADFAAVVEAGAHGPPFVAFEKLPEGFLDGAGEILAGDFLVERAIEADDLVGRDLAAAGIIFRQLA